jgi:hypothetical protein
MGPAACDVTGPGSESPSWQILQGFRFRNDCPAESPFQALACIIHR